MKIGDLIVCVQSSGHVDPYALPVIGCHYTVREISEDGLGIKVEELDNSHVAHHFVGDIEPFFLMKKFRVIVFPPSLTEEIQECLTRELQPCN
jgi:hypothetical protein